MAGRVVLLDVLRGVAILGTLGTNIWIFVTPGGLLGFLDVTPGPLEAAARFVTNGKFLALLTMLFGVGVVIQLDAARRRDERWPGWYLLRNTLLLLDGVLHYVLVVEFDVLMGYAVAGFVVAFVVARSQRVQDRVLAVAVGVHLLAVAAGTVLLAGASLDHPAGAGAGALGGASAQRFATASYPEQILIRLDTVVIGRAESAGILALTVALFLLGGRMWRAGVFDADQTGRHWRRRLAFLGLGVGLPLNLATTLGGLPLTLVDRYVVPPLVAVGYLGLMAMVLDRGVARWWTERLGEVGRTALSAYMLQNVLASVVFYSWGLDLAAHFADHRVLLAALGWLAISTAVVAGSHLWLRQFRQGPIEAVLRVAYQASRRRLSGGRSGPAATVPG